LNHRVLSLLVFLGFTLLTATAQETPVPEAPVTSNFRRFNFNLGGGLGIGKADVGRFVGASYNGVAGAGMNFSRLFGFNAEYMYYGLPFKDSVRQQQFAGHEAGGSIQSASLNAIVTPLHGHLGVYGIFGVGFYVRNVSTTKTLLPEGALWQPAWRWWDLTHTTSGGQPVLPFAQTISSNTKDAGGFNVGGGFTYRVKYLHHTRVYVEARYHRAYHSDGQTTFIPVTVGLRW
jgi:outer membrane protein with beta-barrel domain